MNEGMVIHFSWDVAVQAVRTILARQGLAVVPSFDLRSALASHADCPCPHHGTADCDCQFIVLLVYGQAETPVVMTIHGRDSQTEMKIVQDAVTIPNPRLAEQVMAVLREAARQLFAAPVEAELTYVL